jgi:hypothetical protein
MEVRICDIEGFFVDSIQQGYKLDYRQKDGTGD